MNLCLSPDRLFCCGYHSALCAPDLPDRNLEFVLDTAFEAIPGPLFNPLLNEDTYPFPVCFPADFALLAVLVMDLFILDKADVALDPIDPKLAFTDTDVADKVFIPFAVCWIPGPLPEIFPIPIATAPRLFAIDPILKSCSCILSRISNGLDHFSDSTKHACKSATDCIHNCFNNVSK